MWELQFYTEMNCDLASSRFLHPPESAGLCTRPRHCACAQVGHCPDGQAGSASAVREAEGVPFVLRSKPPSLLQLPQTALPRHQKFIDTPPPINNADSLISTWPSTFCACALPLRVKFSPSCYTLHLHWEIPKLEWWCLPEWGLGYWISPRRPEL